MNNKATAGSRRVLKRYSSQDREKHVKGLKASGKTVKEYCKPYGIPPSTLSWWVRQGKGKPKFRQVEVPEVSNSNGWDAEIVLPGGAKVLLRLNGRNESTATQVQPC
jgi:transposase-like protein